MSQTYPASTSDRPSQALHLVDDEDARFHPLMNFVLRCGGEITGGLVFWSDSELGFLRWLLFWV